MASFNADVATAIGQQVEQMIVQAQKDSESRVRRDLSVAGQQLKQMEALIGELGERVGRFVRTSGGNGGVDPSQAVDRPALNTKIAQLESKWGSEVKALKQDLHRTILAHNHNSDLMRHHRDALDEARRKLDAQIQPKAEQVDAQIEKVDRMLRAGQAKQRALDALTERLTALEQQVGDILPTPGYPGMMPGMAGMAGMVPPGMELDAPAAQPKRGKNKDDALTDEEIRQRMLQATAKGGQAAGETSFNAEAPVFVPRGAGSSSGGGAAATEPAKLGSVLAGLSQGNTDIDDGEDASDENGGGGCGEDGDEAAEEGAEQAES